MSGKAQHGIDRVCPFKEKASPGGDDLMLQPESCQQGVPHVFVCLLGVWHCSLPRMASAATGEVECLALLQSKGKALHRLPSHGVALLCAAIQPYEKERRICVLARFQSK